MKPADMIPLLKTNNPEFAASWADICREGQVKQDAWVKKLRVQGVSAAHPDDGWVNRTTNEITFAYPQFMDDLQLGSLVALGWPDRHRLVELTDLKETRFGSRIWTFRGAQ